ncbi:hypothetical protein BS50DRAFT_635686 [Corynespora cassiicola Philippines]|uniref:HTH cro/C1-type domain-containing protein n=1 Tax=Corynespora cassiicola Philippines TaxID=1448308 RepID=A0A2T2NIG5_CORCC|nr:hypothetical protein BS50DRAFT_635686 [Corynespora cassiicola Philippines]
MSSTPKLSLHTKADDLDNSKQEIQRSQKNDNSLDRKPGTNPCGFFKLPQEIRDMVYDELWKDSSEIHFGTHRRLLQRHGTIVALEYSRTGHLAIKGPIKLDKHFPRWIFTSKLVLREGLTQLNHHALWRIQPTYPIRYCARLDFQINMPVHWKHIELHGLELRTAHRRFCKDTVDVCLFEPHSDFLRRLADLLRPGNNVATLKLKFSFHEEEYSEVKTETRIAAYIPSLDSLLKVSKYLRVLEIDVTDLEQEVSKRFYHDVNFEELMEFRRKSGAALDLKITNETSQWMLGAQMTITPYVKLNRDCRLLSDTEFRKVYKFQRRL